MKKLEELIEDLCPNGVEYKRLAEIFSIYTGLKGKTKEDFASGNCRYISYTNIYNNPEIDLSRNDYVNITTNESQNFIKLGDLLVTGSSETVEDSGMVSVVSTEPVENIAINSFCFGMRAKEKYKGTLLPSYCKHLMRSYTVRESIKKCSFGVTRYNLKKEKFLNVSIPIPPIEVQGEIVRILDSFTQLTAELTAELTARKKQYDYYKDDLLSFNNRDVSMLKLGDFAEIIRGGSFQKKDFVDDGYKCIHYGQIYMKYGLSASDTFTHLNDEVFRKSKKASTGDIIMAVTSENTEDVCKCVAWLGDDDVAISGHTAIIKHNQNPKYLAYYFSSKHFFIQKLKLAHGVKVIEVTPDSLKNITIPMPSMKEQERIVSKLDRFYSLCNDISEGLPAEIEARQKQYEYYRDKLLSFKEIMGGE